MMGSTRHLPSAHPPSAGHRHPSRWLRDQLRSQVIRGGFDGGLLPSETQLMAAYGAPRAAVREALDLLRREKLVERIQGTGTLAVAHRQAARLLEFHGIGGRDQDALGGMSNQVIARAVVPMPPMVARRFGEPIGTDCLLYEYIGYLYGRTLGIHTNYVRFPEAHKVSATPFNSDWFTLLRDAGLTICDTEILIELVAADKAVAELLNIELGSPLLGVQRLIRDEDDRIYDVAVMRSRGDRISLLSRAISPQAVLARDA